MKVCLIPPDCMLHKKMDMDFILAHRVMQSRRYRTHYSQQNTFKILDNGIYEGEMMDVEDVLDMAGEMLVDEVILPDWIMKRTHKQYYVDLIASLPKHLGYMVVPQGRDPAEWKDAYLDLCDLEGISSIGIPIWLNKEFGNARPQVMHYMFRRGELNMVRDHHLLGLDSYWELIMYPPGLIRSVDTSMPFSMAYSNEYSTRFYDPPEHHRVPTGCRLDELNLRILNDEIATLREISRLV